MAMSILDEFKQEQYATDKYNLDGPIGKQYQELVDYWCNIVVPNLGDNVKRYHCYECGDSELQPIEDMQKYDCSLCGGRKCKIHSNIDKNMTCDHCGHDKLCNECLSQSKCCKDYVDGKYVKKSTVSLMKDFMEKVNKRMDDLDAKTDVGFDNLVGRLDSLEGEISHLQK